MGNGVQEPTVQLDWHLAHNVFDVMGAGGLGTCCICG